MINANEAKAMVKEYEKKNAEAAENLANSVLGEIEIAITKNAKIGKNLCIIKIPQYMKSARVSEIVKGRLNENGFRVTMLKDNPNMMVDW